MSLIDLIKTVPKAELHVHIEGTMEPSLLFQLSERNNIPLPYTLEQSIESRKSFKDLQEFLDQYYDACKVLITPEDFYDLARSYFEKAIESNIVHCEVFFDPQTHLSRGVEFSTIIKGLTKASEEVKDRLSVQWIMSFLRNLSEADAIEVIKLAQPFAEFITGVGLDSAEEGNPASKFENAYRLAGEKGLCGDGCFKVAHAGEESDASSIINALYYLGTKRIDHGIRCLDSPHLCKFLKEAQIPLTVCPLSNHKLQVVSRFLSDRKIFKELYDLGVVITINSDDPAFFGGYICENYLLALQDFENDQQIEVLKRLAKYSFQASFIADQKKQIYYELVDKSLPIVE
jgi:adenine deaminase